MYAQETITSSVTGKDGVTYYVVSGTGDNQAFDGVLDVTADLGFGTTNTASLLIRYDFGSMVLTEDSNPALALDPARGATTTIRQGGKAKDNYVVFLVSSGTAARDGTDEIQLSLDEIALSAGGSGSINMHVTDDLRIPAETRAGSSGAVRMMSAPMPVKKCKQTKPPSFPKNS